MAVKIAENFFNINNIKSGKKIFNVCPKFEKYMINDGETNESVRNHPCNLQLPPIKLPDRLDKAVAKYLRDNVPLKPRELRVASKDFKAILWTRALITEKNLSEHVRNLAKDKIAVNMLAVERSLSNTENSQDSILDNVVKNNYKIISDMFKKSIESSVQYEVDDKPNAIRYSANLSNLYLVSRLAPNFAASCKIFYEIRKRCPKFMPTNLYDFGSGVGSAVWAANSVWSIGTIKQHFLVDASTTFLSISEYLLKDGAVKQHLTAIPGITHRSYFSTSVDVEYDIVISCCSLLDIAGGYLSRREIITNLWQKTGKFIIFIEQGTKSGFQAILEARDWLVSSTENDEKPARIFSPCPHSMACPKAEMACSFPVKFEELRLTEQIGEIKQENISYVVLCKGDISSYQSYETEQLLQSYPRIISYKTSGNIQDLCEVNGNANRYYMEIENKSLKRFIRKCKPGDFMPVVAKTDYSSDD